MANFGPLTAEIGSGVWGTQANSNGFRVLASLLQQRHLPEANQITKLCTMFDRLLGWYIIYTFLGAVLMEFCRVQSSLHPNLAISYIDSVTARHSSSGSAKHCGVKQRAPSIFGRDAITLGIGPHSSLFFPSTDFSTSLGRFSRNFATRLGIS